MAYREIFNNTANYLDARPKFFDKLEYKSWTTISNLVEPRTRRRDFSHALSFEVFDPYWMLARQWQYGRFKGDDCGTPVLVKVKTSKKYVDSVSIGKQGATGYTNETPLEYSVEKENREISIYESVEAAIYLKKKLLRRNAEWAKSYIARLMEKYPLENPVPDKAEKDLTIEDLKLKSLKAMQQFYDTYAGKVFDGYKVFVDIEKMKDSLVDDGGEQSIILAYYKWFKEKFLPFEEGGEGCWNISKMSYSAQIKQGANQFVADDYDSGNLSWYSFDHKEDKNAPDVNEEHKEFKSFTYIPTPANVPGAPSQRLWGIENTSVEMGNTDDDDFASMANASMMQYISMYSNDWMVTPLEAEAGVVLNVEGIVVKDTFGEFLYINSDAEDVDLERYKKNHPGDSAEKDFKALRFIDRWCMFGNTHTDAYKNNDFTVNRGLFVPSSVQRNEERTIEEVQFLRDEMANMLWGVENTYSDKAGGSISGKMLSDAVLARVDSERGEFKAKEEEDVVYAYLVENRVPINWIPFIPQQLSDSNREIRFRRGKMPISFHGYKPVRPTSELLKAKVSAEGKVIPMFINEEEVLGYGSKLIKTAQRTRWFMGKSFNWVGNKKKISGYQANSGLMFDELIEKVSGESLKFNALQDKTAATEPAKEGE